MFSDYLGKLIIPNREKIHTKKLNPRVKKDRGQRHVFVLKEYYVHTAGSVNHHSHRKRKTITFSVVFSRIINREKVDGVRVGFPLWNANASSEVSFKPQGHACFSHIL